MLPSQLIRSLIWATSICLVHAASSEVTYSVPEGHSVDALPADTLRAFQRAISELSRREVRPILKNSTSFEKSWDGATLFSYHKTNKQGDKHANASESIGVDIVCTSCYLKASATAELTIGKSFNVSTAFHNLTDQIATQFDNATEAAVHWVGDYVKNTFVNFKDGIDLDDFIPPPIDVDFNIAIPHMPEVRLKFNFDGLELYMMIDSKLTAGLSYNLNLYSSNSPIGVYAGKEFDMGVIFSVDLILTADAEVDISSGFHIKLDDGASFSLAMFADNLTETTFNGGKFEFLPVTVQTAGGILKAVLRLGAHAGFHIKTPDMGIPGLEASAGVEVGVFAHVAEFVTNITVGTTSPKRNDHHQCALRVLESYKLAVGAAAGATLAIAGHKWGPVPQTVVPLFYTTLADACATTSPAAQPTPTIVAPRQADDGNSSSSSSSNDLKTTTLTSKITFTGVACRSTELVNCPASLQRTTKTTSVRTLVTAVPPGSTATFPATTQDAVATTVGFGSRAKKLFETAGSPSSFVPGPTSAIDKLADAARGVDKGVVIGVSVGVGSALVLAAAAGGYWYYVKRVKYQRVSRVAKTHMLPLDDYPTAYDPHKSQVAVTTTEREVR